VAAPAEPVVAQAVEVYLDHLAVERGLAANTLLSYRRDLSRFSRWLDASGRRRLSEVSEADVAGFLAALRTGDDEHPPLSSSSAGRAVVAVRGLHRFALREGWTAADPAREVRPPVPARRLPKAISVSAVEALLAAPDTGTPLGLRDRALLELLYGTGARISEAIGLDVDDLDRAAGLVRLDGKGGKQRVVPVGSYAGGPSRTTWCALVPGWSPRVGGPTRCSSTPGAGGCRGRAPGRCSGPPPRAPASPGTSRRTPCGTASRPTCSTGARTSAWCRSCSATPR
jgi:site-specific recombinase XerC